MDKCCMHQKIYDGYRREYYFFTWSIPVPSINNKRYTTNSFTMQNGLAYHAYLNFSENKTTFGIVSNSVNLTCFVSMLIGSKTLLLSNSLNKPTSTSKQSLNYSYELVSLSSRDETCQKLKQHPDNTLVLICRIIWNIDSVSSGSVKTFGNTSTYDFSNLETLTATFNNSPESLLKEMVHLRVGEESETVSKAVLCAGSTVFAKMFQSNMTEVKENTVIITDIKMPVLKVLVCFLYTGRISNCGFDFDFLCELYYASSKYDVTKLLQICIDLLLPLISMDNVIRVWKFAYCHDDVLLKSTAIALIATNIEKWFATDDWKNLVNDEPKIAAEILNFLQDRTMLPTSVTAK